MSSHEIVPIKHYIINFLALTVLMFLTVFAARYDLGAPWINFTVAISIAITKATLIVLVFMDVRNSSQLTWVFTGAGFFWLMILLTFVITDFVAHDLGTANTIPLPGR